MQVKNVVNNMPDKSNLPIAIAVIEEKITNIWREIADVRNDVQVVKNELYKDYATKNFVDGLDKRVSKGENIWDWGIKIILATLILGVLALLGLKAK
jgi:hypothetical protein